MGTTGGEERVIVRSGALLTFAEQALVRLGVPEEDARSTAETLVDADRRGVHTHGIFYLPTYVARLVQGGINPLPHPTIVSETAATAILDGDNGLGQVISVRAMDLAIAKARSASVGLVGARNSNHFGAAGFYALRAAREGMIGFAMSNIGPTMPAWGGATPCFGNNPIAYAVPAPAGPVVLDMATSVVARGKVEAALARGERIPLGWAYDRDGRPTDDPRQALAGMLLPFAGHKGYGIAFLIDILSGVLTGGAFGQQVGNLEPYPNPGKVCHFFAAIDIAAFVPPESFATAMTELIGMVKASSLAEGFTEVLVPGELENEAERANGRSVSLPPHAWKASVKLATELGLLPLLEGALRPAEASRRA